MSYTITEELMGVVDAREEPASGGLVLVDADDKVLAGRFPDAVCRRGAALMRLFPMPAAEESALALHRRRRAREALLLQSREAPLVFFDGGGVAGGRGLMILPPKEAAAALMAPLLYLDRAPSWLRISTYGVSALTQPREELYHPMARWLSEIRELLAAPSPEGSATEVLRLIRQRITRLARLTGVRLEYDLGGLGFFPLPDADLDALTLQTAAVLLLAGRVVSDKSVYFLVDREGPDLPVAHAVLRLRRADVRLPELQGLEEDAALRGNLFCAARSPEDPRLLHVRFTFSRKELSLQEMRNHFDWLG
ncbi:MAG: hypothetical protein E7644_02600 [Ruminococcaceae bacterium]|nr:hypothetical protein [Oscillospiraceae bacterium]